MFMVIVTWCALVPIILNKTMELLIGIACFAALGYYGYLMAGLLDARNERRRKRGKWN